MAGDGHGGMHSNQDHQSAGNGPQGLHIFDGNSTDDPEDDDSTNSDPLEDWAEVGTVDPNWVAGEGRKR